MLFFIIELDEERIEKDEIISLSGAYECIEATFAQRDVTLCHQEGAVRTYTRNIDKHDYEYLWSVNSLFEKKPWFGYYVKQWRFLDIDDKTGKIWTDENVLEEWGNKYTKEDVLHYMEKRRRERENSDS